MTRTRAARTRAMLLVSGVLCLGGAVVPAAGAAEADAEKGSGLGSFSLSANAPAVQVQVADGGRCGRSTAGAAECEGVVPITVSQLAQGPVGFALSSVVWPGTLAGNLGSTIILTGGPPEAGALNSPVRAEARTGGDGKEVVYDDVPGARMTAQAAEEEVTAAAELASSQTVGVGTFGNTRSRTRTAVTGVSTAVAEAASTVNDVEIAGGLVKIGSVASTAKATTDGKAARVEGRTVTTGMTIADVPVEISDEGIRVADQANPLNKTLTATVNAAIEQAGMTIALSEPVQTLDKGNAQYRSGSLVFVWQPTPEQQFTAVLGGAAVEVMAEPALDFDLGGGEVAPPVDVAPVAPLEPVDGGSLPTTVDVPAPLALDAGDAPVADVAAPAAPGEEPVLAAPVARGLSLPDGISPVSLALGLVGAGLLAAGFRRLPDRLLQDGPTTACVLEGAA